MQNPQVQVGLSDYGYRQDMLLGIAGYRDKHTDWELQLTGVRLRPFPSTHLEGALIHITNDLIWEAWRKQKVPVINLASSFQAPVPTLCPDDFLIGQIAAEHFLERNFEHFAYLGPPRRPHAEGRLKGFSDVITHSGNQVDCFEASRPNRFYDELAGKPLLDWLDSLPRPCAIFCCDDSIASKLTDRILAHGGEIPSQYAILGVNNHLAMCAFSRRPLSSVIIGGYQLGFQGAALLHREMECPSKTPEKILLEPVGIALRLSTDISADQNPVVARAMQFIRKNLHQSMKVQEIADAIGVSKRLLERSFKDHFSHGPATEITQLRIHKAKQLLKSTSWPLHQIAEAVGYPEYSLFSTNFRQHEGIPPKEWRKSKVEAKPKE